MKVFTNYKIAALVVSLLLCLCGLQSRAQNDAIYMSGNVTVNAGDTVRWYGNVTADASTRLYIQNGAVIYFYGQSFTLMPGAQVFGATDALFTAITQGQGTGKVAFQQPNPNNNSTVQQMLDGGNATVTTQNTLTGIRINNPLGVQLVNTHSRIGSEVNFVNGHLYTNGKDVRLAANGTFTGYNQNSYVVTNGTGDGSVSHVVAENLAASLVFPIGMADADYTPATITPSASNTVHVNVTSYANSASVENGNNSNGFGMQRTWNIYGDAAGNNTTIALQHNSSTNQAHFNTAGNFVTRYLGSNWEINTAGASTPGTPAAGTEVKSLAYTALATSAANNGAYYSKGSANLNGAPFQTEPDFNVTYINIPVSGNVATNDNAPSGTTYGTPVAMPGYSNPNASLPSMNANGTYTFVSSVPGDYLFSVPVCYQYICTNQQLEITVLDNVNPKNPPVANVDISTTKQNTPVTIPVLANDQPGTPGTILPPGNLAILGGTTPAGGTATANPDGTVTYTPPAGFIGTDTVRYKICDNGTPSLCDNSLAIVTVIPTGSPNTTTAADDYVTTKISTPVNGNVLTNDHDAEGNTQTAVAQTNTVPGKGTLVLNANGAFTFTPVNGFIGPVDFTYAIFDNGTPVARDSATIHVLVQGPVLQTSPDFNVTYINTPVSGNVATNDNAPSGTTYGTPVAMPGYSNPNNALPVMNANGTYTFVTSAPGDYLFSVPVCYQGVCTNQQLEITVLDNVNPHNPPVANVDISTTKQNTPVTIPVLANDQPGTPGTILPPGNLAILGGTTPAGGTATANPDGTVTYTPPAGFIGTDTVRYKICDNGTPSLCDNSFAIVTVIPTGSPNTTTAADDYVTTKVSTPVNGNVLTNDHDAEGNTQTAVAQTKTVPGKGTLVLNANGAFTFTPVNGFIGPVDFTYAIFDNGTPVARDSATVHVLVQGPVLQTEPDFNVTYINTPVSGNVATNDNVPSGTTYGTPTAQPGYSNPNSSLPVMNANGTYTFVSSAPGDYLFSVPVCYQGVCTNQQLEITVLDNVNPKNPPVANVDNSTTKQNTPVTIPVLANDQPGTPGTTLPPGNLAILGGTTPAGGTATANPDGTVTYTPPAGFIGTDTVRYKICDNGTPSLCDNSLAIVTVIPTGSPNTTTAADDYVTTKVSTPVNGNVLTNDHDAEGNTQTAVAQTKTVPGKGTLVLNANGTFTFTPVRGFIGPVDFPYAIFDNGTPVARDSATVHVLVQGPALQTDPDFNVTYINTPVSGNVATNDNVPSGTNYGTPTAQPGYSNPNNALPVMNANGSYNFVSSAPGEYNFSVPVCNLGICTNQVLNITVLDSTAGAHNPPIANIDLATTLAGTPVTINTLGNDRPGTPGSILVPSSVTITNAQGSTVTTATSGASVSVDAQGNTIYTPLAGFTGIDTIYYRVCDNQSPSLCNTSMQIVTVLPVSGHNTTTADDDFITTAMGVSASGNVLANDHDAEGNAQTVVAQTTTITGKGKLVLNADGSYTFTPIGSYVGPVDFPYAIYDNGSPVAHDSATLHILVVKAPDYTPVIDIDAQSFSTGDTKDFVVEIDEVADQVNLGQVAFRIVKTSAFTITFNPLAATANVGGGTVVNNADWTITQTAGYILCTLKPGKTISHYGSSLLGFTIARNAAVSANTSQPLTAIIIGGSGGDSNISNNTNSVTVTATTAP